MKTAHPVPTDTTGLLSSDGLKYHDCLTYWRTIIPYANIKVTGGSEALTTRQKTKLIVDVTELLARILDKNPETTVIVIDEVDMEDWGISDESAVVRRWK